MLIYKTNTRFLFKLSLKYWRMYPVAVVLIFSPFFLWLSAIQGTELQKGNSFHLQPLIDGSTLSIQIFLKPKYFLINIHLLVFHCFDQYWQLQSLQRKVSGPEGHGFLWHKIVFLRRMSPAWKAFTSIKVFFSGKIIYCSGCNVLPNLLWKWTDADSHVMSNSVFDCHPK